MAKNFVYSRSVFNGLNAEVEFCKLAETKGFEVKKVGFKKDFSHIDAILTSKGGKTFSFDIKARKKLSRSNTKESDQVIWIEFKSNSGKEGWLFGEADYLAFQNSVGFLIIPRLKLVDWCKTNIDGKTKVKNSSEAYKKVYTREGRKDLISYVTPKDIAHLGKEWT